MNAVTVMDPHNFASEYEFRADEGDYTPTDGERAMIEDAICGYLALLPTQTEPGLWGNEPSKNTDTVLVDESGVGFGAG